MPTYTTTTKYALRALVGSNLASDIDQGFADLASDIDSNMAGYAEGTLVSRPAAGKAGRLYRTTDTGRVYMDSGTAWIELTATRIGADLQKGVIDAGSYMVTQHGSGGTSNMSVDVASNTGAGAYVNDDSVVGLALQYVAPTVGVTNLAIASNASGNPRIDRIVVSTLGVVSVVAGTASAGATLNNLTGAAAVPASSLLLADVLVANGAAAITNAVIRDRRLWARGANVKITRTQNAAAGNDYSIASATLALIDATNLAPRIECSGVPVRCTLRGNFTVSAVTECYFSPQVDGAGVDGMASVGATGSFSTTMLIWPIATNANYREIAWEFTPSAGSHVIAPAWGAVPTWTLMARAARPMQWVVEELVSQDSADNSVTSG